jgi:hypothetical protein
MAYTFRTTLRTARNDAITTNLSTGSKLQIYTSAYGTKLAEWTWTGNAFAASSSGAMSMNTPTTNPVTPLANGTAAIARHTLTDGTTQVINDLTVGTSGADVILSNLSVVTTSPITLNSYTITEA